MSDKVNKDNSREESWLSRFRGIPYARTIWLSFLAALLLLIIYFCIERYSGLFGAINKTIGVLMPLIIGLVMAFLMNPIMMLFERVITSLFEKRGVNGNKSKKNIRLFTSILAMLVFLGMVMGFFAVIIPQVVATVNYLVENIHEQIGGILDWANTITKGRYEDFLMSGKNTKNINVAINRVIVFARNFLNLNEDEIYVTLANLGIGAGRLFVNILVGIFVSVYALVGKERFIGQGKKLLYGIFSVKTANTVLEISRKANEIFYGFFIGKLIDSVIIGLICYAGMVILSFPYPILSSFIIGITNIVPVFGPYIGAIPTVAIIFITNPVQGVYFLIFVLVLQQIDGNIIGPKILGESTGIPAFWVIVAIVIGGGFFGFIGMIVSVPIFAFLNYLIGRAAKHLTRTKNLPTSTSSYIMVERINSETKELIYQTEEEKKRKKPTIISKLIKTRKEK